MLHGAGEGVTFPCPNYVYRLSNLALPCPISSIQAPPQAMGLYYPRFYRRSCQAWTKLQVDLEDGNKASLAVSVRDAHSRTRRLTKTLPSGLREGTWCCDLVCEDFLRPRMEGSRGNNVVRTNCGYCSFVFHSPLAHLASHPRL